MKGISAAGLQLALTNVILAILFGLFSYAHAVNFLRFQALSSLLMMVNESLNAVFFLIRRAPLKTSKSSYHWTVGIAGTFFTLLFRPIDPPSNFPLGHFLQYVSLLMQVLSIFSLNRSFGIVAANRGIKTTGLYGIVRHPIYSSYLIGHTAYIINNLSSYNVLIFAATTSLHILRIFAEESFLNQESAYVEYKKQTKWRLIPLVF